MILEIYLGDANRVPLNFKTVGKSTALIWQSTGCISDEDTYILYSNLYMYIYIYIQAHRDMWLPKCESAKEIDIQMRSLQKRGQRGFHACMSVCA